MSTNANTDTEHGVQALLFALAVSGATFNLLLVAAGLRSVIIRRTPFHALMFFFLISDLIIQVVVAVSSAISLHTRTHPDTRLLSCQVQSVIILWCVSASLLCTMAMAISRYLVIVKQRQVCRRSYLLMLVGFTLIPLLQVIPIMADPALAQCNSGKLLCTVEWANGNDSHQLYITVFSLVQFNLATAVSNCCYYQCFQHVKLAKQSLSHFGAVECSSSAEIVQCRRLFYLILALWASNALVGGQVWYEAVSGEHVAPLVDQLAALCWQAFFIVQAAGMVWINKSYRHALVALLTFKRHSSIQPDGGGSKRWSQTENASNNTAMPSTSQDTSHRHRATVSSVQRDSSELKRQISDLNCSRNTTLVSPTSRLTAALEKRSTYWGPVTRANYGHRRTASDSTPTELQRPVIAQSVDGAGPTVTATSPARSPRHRLDAIASARNFSPPKSVHDVLSSNWLQPVLPTINGSPQHSITIVQSPALADNTASRPSRHAMRVSDTLLQLTAALTEPSLVHHGSVDAPDTVSETQRAMTRATTQTPSDFSQQTTKGQLTPFDPVLVG